MKRYHLLLLVLILLTVGLLFARVVVSNSISTDGVALGRIEEEEDALKTQNLIYKEKIYTLSSLGNISAKASKLGFVESKSSLVVSSSLPIAQR